MNNDNESYELEEMRQQIALLKGKLEKEKLMNNELLYDAMNKRVDRVRRKIINNIITGICMVIIIPIIMYKVNLFTSSLCVFVVISTIIEICFNLYLKKIFPDRGKINSDLITSSLAIHKFIKLQNQYYMVACAWIILVASWIAIVVSNLGKSPIVIIIGMGIGSAIGLYQFKKTIKTSKELRENIKQIKELREE